jgi:hypothetical protein
MIRINYIPIVLNSGIEKEKGLYHSSILYILPWKARFIENSHILYNMIPHSQILRRATDYVFSVLGTEVIT